MINPRELRIGNFIYEIIDTPTNTEHKELFEVAAVNSLTNTVIDKDDNITSFEYCEPIPLTEELILKAGFEKAEGFYAMQIGNNVHITFEYNLDFGIGLGWRGVGAYIWGEVKYFHQLQNIYFDLTCEELKFEL